MSDVNTGVGAPRGFAPRLNLWMLALLAALLYSTDAVVGARGRAVGAKTEPFGPPLVASEYPSIGILRVSVSDFPSIQITLRNNQKDRGTHAS
jgi:hypothetical protein